MTDITEVVPYFEIRPLTAPEIPGALSLVWEVFQEFEAPDYSPEGVSKFKECIDDPVFVGRLTLYGAFTAGSLGGVLATRENGSHISLFFVRGALHRRGIGRRLFEAVEPLCPSGIMTVNSSPFAVPVYEKLGFFPTDAEKETDGIRYTQMIYRCPNGFKPLDDGI